MTLIHLTTNSDAFIKKTDRARGTGLQNLIERCFRMFCKKGVAIAGVMIFIVLSCSLFAASDTSPDKKRDIRTVISFKPDLVISELSHTPADPTTLDLVTIKAVVANEGTTPSASCVLSIKAGGETFPERYNVPVLAPGASHTVTRVVDFFNLPIGFFIKAVADVDDDVQELDENNNEDSYVLMINNPPLPDLVIQSLSHLPANPTTVDPVTLMAVVANEGTTASASCILTFKVGGETFPKRFNIPPLDPGTTHTVTRVYTFTAPYAFLIKAVVDADDEIMELDEENNEESCLLHVEQAIRPDLVIHSMTHTPETPTTTETVTLKTSVSNEGTTDSEACLLTIRSHYLDIDETHTVPPLDMGTSHTFISQVMFSRTVNHRVTATVDPDDTIPELFEDNNSMQIFINVVLPPLPDLTVEELTFVPDSPLTSSTVTLSATVRNIGEMPSASTFARFSIDIIGVSYDVQVTPLDVGSTVTVDVPVMIFEPDTYNVRVEINPEGLVWESNDENNDMEIVMDVQAALSFERIRRYLLGLESLDATEKIRADVNYDGVIDVSDLIVLFNAKPD